MLFDGWCRDEWVFWAVMLPNTLFMSLLFPGMVYAVVGEWFGFFGIINLVVSWVTVLWRFVFSLCLCI